MKKKRIEMKKGGEVGRKKNRYAKIKYEMKLKN
jgi:hypothetical protein